MDVHLIITSLDFFKAYDRVFHEAIHCMLDSWNISGKLRDLLNSFLIPTCKVVGVHGFPDSLPFQQHRGLPTGAPEAPMLFLALAIWWEHGKAAWIEKHPNNLDFDEKSNIESELLPTKDITYADDKNLFNLYESTAQREVHYVHETGPFLGLILNRLKCVVRRILANSAYTDGTAKRTHLHRVLPPPAIYIGKDRMPTDLPLKIFGGGVSCQAGASTENFLALWELKLSSKN